MVEPRTDMIDSAAYQRLDPAIPLAWSLVKAHRASKGMVYADPSLPAFAPAYRGSSRWFVAYHYVTGGGDPRTQFDNFQRSVARIGGLRPGEVPMLDCEMSATVDRWTTAEALYRLMVAAYGRCLVYSAPWVAGFSSWRKRHPDWPLVVAHYGDRAQGWALCERLRPVVWQHTGDAGRFPGILGPVDLDMVLEPDWFGPEEVQDMGYPVVTMVRPSALAGLANGKLPASALVQPGFPLRPTAKLERTAARAWLALSAGCKAATGVVLTCTSTADTYRSYDQQVSTFYRRYVRTDYPTWAATSSGRRRSWNDGQGSSLWVLRAGTAPSATPGTSNHGWALAVDCGWVTPSNTVGYLAASKAWSWMLGNAGRFGWSWESQVEPWHIRYNAGDKVPQAVLDFEAPVPAPAPEPVFDPANGAFGLWPLNASKPIVQRGSTGDAVRYLQGVLRQLTVDGEFGARTLAAVVAFQTFMGLPIDGVVGARTWAAVDKLAAAHQAAA